MRHLNIVLRWKFCSVLWDDTSFPVFILHSLGSLAVSADALVFFSILSESQILMPVQCKTKLRYLHH